ncbi:MAG TPA: hypothetical protein VGG16_09290 [Streptosporangiaceae bacterium]
MRDLTGILITHQHADHIDEATLPALVKANPDAAFLVDPDTVPIIEKLGLTAQAIKPRTSFPIHEGLLAQPAFGYAMIENFTKEIAGFTAPKRGEPVEV